MPVPASRMHHRSRRHLRQRPLLLQPCLKKHPLRSQPRQSPCRLLSRQPLANLRQTRHCPPQNHRLPNHLSPWSRKQMSGLSTPTAQPKSRKNANRNLPSCLPIPRKDLVASLPCKAYRSAHSKPPMARRHRLSYRLVTFTVTQVPSRRKCLRSPSPTIPTPVVPSTAHSPDSRSHHSHRDIRRRPMLPMRRPHLPIATLHLRITHRPAKSNSAPFSAWITK